MPNWMIPKSSIASSGRTSANSTIVWPSELCRLRGVGFFIWRRFRLCGCVLVRPCASAQGLTEGSDASLLDRVGDPVDHVRDVASEQQQGGNDERGDHRKDHRVLGHRLTLLVTVELTEERLHVCGELQHQLHLPSGVTGMAFANAGCQDWIACVVTE